VYGGDAFRVSDLLQRVGVVPRLRRPAFVVPSG
jgi:hypothetical protein